MTREEKIAKLKTIRVVVTDIVATYDMGLEFTTMTSQGVTTQMGNVGQWPCYVINNEHDQMRQLMEDVRNGKETSDDEILQSLLGQILTTYNDLYNGSVRITDNELVSEILAKVREKLNELKDIGDRLYVYATLESWNLQIEFFTTEEKLADFFVENWGTAEESYESMADEEINEYYVLAEDEGFYSLPYSEIGFNKE